MLCSSTAYTAIASPIPEAALGFPGSWLDDETWERGSAPGDADAPQSILARPDYYGISPVTLCIAQLLA